MIHMNRIKANELDKTMIKTRDHSFGQFLQQAEQVELLASEHWLNIQKRECEKSFLILCTFVIVSKSFDSHNLLKPYCHILICLLLVCVCVCVCVYACMCVLKP